MSTTTVADPAARVRFLVPVAGDRWLDITSAVRQVDYEVRYDDCPDLQPRDDPTRPWCDLRYRTHCHVTLTATGQGADLALRSGSALRVVASSPADTPVPWPWTFTQDFTIDTVSSAPEEAL